MSTLFEQASLVMIPSGYKEDVVYSVKPTDGSGDLTFTRASDGTRVNSQGLVERVPWNLLQQSETFDNGYWGKNNLSVSANTTTAPNGTTTADTLTTTSTAQCQLITYFDFLVGNYTLSIYVKKVDLGFTYVEFGYAFCWVNLTTGEITGGSQYSTGWTFVSANATSVGDGWFKVEIVASCSIAGTYGVRPLQPVPASGEYNSQSTNKATYLWGAQVNIGSTAKPYFPTTDRQNVPRLDYSNGCPSLLLEPQRTNLVTYSEQIDNAAWTKGNTTVTANQTTSPDGTQNADLATATSGGELLQGLVLNTSTSYTFSFYVKKGTATDAKYRVYNFDAGTNIVAPTSYISQTNTSTWVRVSVSFTSSATGVNYGIYLLDSASAGTMYFWGAQLEAGSYATSYIPTTSSTVTRVADEAIKTGISSLIGQSEGTLFCEVNFKSNDAGTYLAIEDWANAEVIRLYSDAGPLNAQIYANANVFLSQTSYNAVVGQSYKMAMSYSTSGASFYVNGVLINETTASLSIPTCSNVRLAAFTSGQEMNADINQAVLFKTRLTNAELASLTTL